MSMKKKNFLKRRFQLHWGGGWITEEARQRRSTTSLRFSFSPSIRESGRSDFVITMTVFTKGGH
jgi:hypothetical protein